MPRFSFTRNQMLIGGALIGGIAAVSSYLFKTKSSLMLKSLDSTEIENENYKLSISPMGVPKGNVYVLPRGISIKLTNTSDDTIKVDWLNTHYTFNGNTEEGFLHDGKRDFKSQMMSPRRTDIVLPGKTLIKFLKPRANVREYHLPSSVGGVPVPSGPKFYTGGLGVGIHGVYICLQKGDEKITEHPEFELEVVQASK